TIVSGAVVADLSGAQPRFEFTGKAAGIAWRGGLIEAVGAVITSGAGSDLLTKLTARGAFTARNLDLSPSPAFSVAHGEFDLSWGKGTPRLTLTPLTATTEGSNWTGTAETRDSGEVVLKLASGPKQLQAAGAVFKGEPLKPAATSAP
ncbi:MAG TPA: hypothetical protein VNH18_15885, partial [Bryobacteraceae bacterium]|nr:hypothetical protein [Bryobacteraceae bacterium]